MSAADVIFERTGRCGAITLNRPAALNAIDLQMVRTIGGALDDWENDPAISCVLIRGAGERAFCAGADIRALYQMGKAEQHAAQLDFFRGEYRLNRRIKLYPKPIVALADGIVMGGGAGLSVHAAQCLAGDALDFAMPEAGIGFFPDVGATFFLPRLPGRIGEYLALTGARIGCADAVAIGLASAYVPTSHYPALVERLIDGEDPATAVAAEARSPPASALLEQQPLIDRCFAAASIAGIVASLEAEDLAFARATRDAMMAKSPSSLAVALRQLRIGGGLSIDDALRTEFRIATRIIKAADYYEGVRAAIIDKDRRPAWRPAAIDALTATDVDSYFLPLTDELTFAAQLAVT